MRALRIAGIAARAAGATRLLAATCAVIALALAGCATEGGATATSYYSDYPFYDDPWYWQSCCVDPPDGIGPPRPEHPIALPPGSSSPRPENPIANPPPSRPSTPAATPRATPMPRAAARGGGGRR
jgi:hypothetical protein